MSEDRYGTMDVYVHCDTSNPFRVDAHKIDNDGKESYCVFRIYSGFNKVTFFLTPEQFKQIKNVKLEDRNELVNRNDSKS